MNSAAHQVIAKLGLKPLPGEGGFYRSTWTSTEKLASGRALGSAIYFLLSVTEFSALHRLATEELWHFYAGDAIDHVQLDPAKGEAVVTRLGAKILSGEIPQLTVTGGLWQGARIAPGGEQGWTLVGCTLSPAWTEAEFELGDRAALLRAFPQQANWVRELTR